MPIPVIPLPEKFQKECSLSLPKDMIDPNKYFSGYNLKNTGRKQKFDMPENIQFGLESKFFCVI